MAELQDRNWFQNRMIYDYAKGLTFADIGGLWGTINEKISIALDAGASSATMVDLIPFNHELWRDFDQRVKELGFAEYRRHTANLDDHALHLKIGKYDFVHCSGIIYHVPSLVFTLDRLASVTRKYLLLGSMVVPEKVENEHGSIDFSNGSAVFIPAIDERKRLIMAAYFQQRGLEVMHINHPKPEPFRINGAAHYGPWWWLYSPSTMKGMLEASNFRVVADAPVWEGRSHYFLCERV